MEREMSGRKIKAVFFDAGNTLLFPDYNFIAGLVAGSGLETTPAELIVSEYDARRAVDIYLGGKDGRDEMVWDIYFTTMLHGVGMLDEAIVSEAKKRLTEENAARSLWNYAPEESIETLQLLKSEGYKLGIISNADGRLHSTLKETGLDKLLNFAIDSRLVGYEKPDPRIFKLALEFAGETAAACVHVGDIVSADVEGARAVGISPVLLDPTGRHQPGCPVISALSEIVALVTGMNS
jgi:HAD superfamily hydrolase (TIGR01549 family)